MNGLQETSKEITKNAKLNAEKFVFVCYNSLCVFIPPKQSNRFSEVKVNA